MIVWHYDGPPPAVTVQGQLGYIACTRYGSFRDAERQENGVHYMARDWRVDSVSKQTNETFPRETQTPYFRRRCENVLANNVIDRTMDRLRGAESGRPVYVILSGPSVIDNLRDTPPRSGDVVIATNRGIVYSPVPVDYFYVLDGLVSQPMIGDWVNEAVARGLTTWQKFLDNTHETKLIMHQWSDPSLKSMFRAEDVYFVRSAGIGPELRDSHVNMSLPGLEYCYNSGSCSLNLGDVLGASEIVLVGADYAYTKNCLHPFEPAPRSSHMSYYVHQSIRKDKQMVVSDPLLQMSSHKLEAWAWMLSQKYHVPCVNLTNNGILDHWFLKERPGS